MRNGHSRSLFYNAVLSALNNAEVRSVFITAKKVHFRLCLLSKRGLVWSLESCYTGSVRLEFQRLFISPHFLYAYSVCPDALVVLVSSSRYYTRITSTVRLPTLSGVPQGLSGTALSESLLLN